MLSVPRRKRHRLITLFFLLLTLPYCRKQVSGSASAAFILWYAKKISVEKKKYLSSISQSKSPSRAFCLFVDSTSTTKLKHLGNETLTQKKVPWLRRNCPTHRSIWHRERNSPVLKLARGTCCFISHRGLRMEFCFFYSRPRHWIYFSGRLGLQDSNNKNIGLADMLW